MTDTAASPALRAAQHTSFAVLFAISGSHLINDMLQAVLPAIYPNLKSQFHLSFVQIGLVTLVFQCTASLLQPWVGYLADKRPAPYSLAAGMVATLLGILLLARAGSYHMVLLAAALVGIGSSVFHPESARVARMASGGRYGLAQSLFQVGGNFGQALGPMAAALIVVPFGQGSIVGFSGVAAIAMVILWRLGAWYKPRMRTRKQAHAERQSVGLSSGRVKFALVVLVVLCFSKAFYLAGINSYYTFFLIHKFGVSTQTAQIYLFVFLAASACGVFFGGPLGDRFGRKYVIWFSIVGALPFTLMLPYASLTGNLVLSVLIGFIISSAMPAIIVYAQELMPHRFGMISGLFFGFVFGIGGIGAAVLGYVADRTSIDFVYQVCAFLPAIGLLAVFLPQLKRQHA